jgi:HlyD family secretion protein
MKRKAISIATGVAVLSGIGAWAHFRGRQSADFRTVSVDRGEVASTVSATGNLNAVVTVQVGAQVSGNIKELHANYNTRVNKGQLVARIDPEIYQARVNQAQANLDAARAAVLNAEAAIEKTAADVSSARAQLAIAQANLAKELVNAGDMKTKYGRQQQLFNQGLVATADRDTAQAAFDAQTAAVGAAQAQVQAARDAVTAAEAQRGVAKAAVASAQANVKQQTAALQQAQIDLVHTFIYAPVDGTVIARQVDVGQTVVASMQAPALFQIAQDLTKMQVDTNVGESDVGRAHVGQPATFTVDAYPGRKFRGQVAEVRQAPINVQNVVTYDVVVTVSNPDLKLIPGMTANVNILTDQRENALRIPNAALRFRPPETAAARPAMGRGAAGARREATAQTVYIVGRDEKPAPVPVKPGISDGVYTEVAGGELAEGQHVIVGLTQTASAGRSPEPGGGPRGPRF